MRRAIVPTSIGEVWVLIDNQQSNLTVYQGNVELARFAPIRFGRGGADLQRVMGDRTTPLGEFHVNRFNYDSKFDIFIGLDYPTPLHARMALESGVYTEYDYDAYFDYYRRHQSPPQDTVLGGYIGIHGVGEGDMNIHRNLNWTDGCVAVTNQEIEQLASLIGVGTRVVIR
ncbi:L,D-transpeptidase family protein [Halomonas cupida]|uniref:L,D-transpeptidase family protein n=1 Tax=Halomonas cupida TaxID=44933 RepID=UPI0027D98E92|nr:L,D-transpeptidase [Halomonas cupida]